MKKFSEIKRSILKYFAQIFGNYLFRRMQIAIELKDQRQFSVLSEKASKLNDYCIIFHDIYLD